MKKLPKPYYQDEAVTIYHGDCRELLPEIGDVDLVLTDPPYGIAHTDATWHRRKHNRQDGSSLAVRRDYGDFVLRPPASDLIANLGQSPAVVWGGNFFSLPPSSRWLVWDKRNGANSFADCELAWTNLKGATRIFRWRWSGMLQEDMANKEERLHPTQKPIALMRWCLELVPAATLILDPFMGSGTTLRAAKDLGRKAIGIEIEEKYCEIAAKRMRKPATGDLFKPRQRKRSVKRKDAGDLFE